MKKRTVRIISQTGKVMALLVAILLFAACAPKGRAPQGMLDTPLHHYNTGMRLLDTGTPAAAIVSFEQALSLHPEYGPALSGKGLALVTQGEIEAGLTLIEDGQREADEKASVPEVLWTQVAEIRAYVEMVKQQHVNAEEVVDAAKSACRRAVQSLPQDAPAGAMAWFWLGEVQTQATLFSEAVGSFRHARKLDGGYAVKAAKRLQLLERIQEAALLTSVGKRIALVDEISRADMAALLVEELGVNKFFANTAPLQERRFIPPTENQKVEKEAPDAVGHPLLADIEVILFYAVRGLERFADGTFQPDRPLTRAEASLVAEDVYVRARNDAAMATRYVGTKSPFSDVRGDHPYFNAVMFSTARGYFHADVKGRFYPFATVSGVEAVLLINALRTSLDVL